ncbi:endonuclease/exonuclease/phosphatase family protein [Haloferula sargassicola]|uniref:Endonuclease/exonuclease/phosphatase domain-containing protein n=1 Tax=Haloferula sargassicola TaxID=490096 RepID=A0ABP9UUN1_9BACT
MNFLPLRMVAPIGFGAFFLALASCKDQEKNAWPGPTVEEKAAEAAPAATPPAEATQPAPVAEAPAAPPAAEEADPELVRFIAYNLENWLSMDRYVDGQSTQDAPKPEKEKEAAVTLIARHRPDILGVCEIGQKSDLQDLQARLAKAGLDLPNLYHTGGADDTRHLGLLTRFPIASTTPHTDLEYSLEGRKFIMGRGVLDAVVETPNGPVHFFGAHLKSKREIPEADQEEMRRAEARLLREQVDHVLEADPETPLIVYGDMNETRGNSAVRILQGPRNGPMSLGMAYLRDSVGTTWTHFWSYQDVYSRFDYVLFSHPMTSRFEWDHCKVLDDPEVGDASDHRPLYVEFR